MANNLRYALRWMWKSPGFTGAAVLALALGIGANSAIFSVVNGILVRPLPYPEQDRIAMLWVQFLGQNVKQSRLSPPEYLDFKRDNRVFSGIAACYDWKYSLTGEFEPERIQAAVSTADLWQVLRVGADRGRTFTADEDRPGHDQVAVLSHAFWVRRFGGSDAIIGRSITLSGKPYTVLGVMPASFAFPSDAADVWLPMALDPADPGGRFMHYLTVVARLKPGVQMAQAQSEVRAIAGRIQRENQKDGFYPADSGWGAVVRPLYEDVVGEIRPALLVLMGAVAFVLLIACANVANLLLARGESRQREIALRSAIGAGSGDIFRQLVTESTLLSLIGGACGLGLAAWGVDLLVSLNPPNIPRLAEVSTLDPLVLGFTLLVSLATGLVFGLAPARHASRVNLHESLKEGGRAGSASRAAKRVREVLVIVEMGFSLILLICAGLMVKSFLTLQRVSPGFRADHALSLQLTLPRSRFKDGTAQTAFWKRLTEEVEGLPQVAAAGAVSQLPLTSDSFSGNITIEGRPTPPGEVPPEVDLRTITPDYLAAMRIPIVAGRPFTTGDRADAPAVALVDQASVKRFWPDGSPVGKRVQLGGAGSKSPWATVVGVVGNVKQRGLSGEAHETFYFPDTQNPQAAMSLVVRARSAPEALAAPIRQVLSGIDRDLPASRVVTMERLLYDSLARERFNAALLGILAAIALVLAVVGIYSVVSYHVHQQAHEIGIRMAIGANRRDVLGMVIRQALKLAAIGAAAGLAGAVLLTRLLHSLLFEVSATDVATFAAVPLLLIGVTIAASYLPARWATGLEPLNVLRQE